MVKQCISNLKIGEFLHVILSRTYCSKRTMMPIPVVTLRDSKGRVFFLTYSLPNSLFIFDFCMLTVSSSAPVPIRSEHNLCRVIFSVYKNDINVTTLCDASWIIVESVVELSIAGSQVRCSTVPTSLNLFLLKLQHISFLYKSRFAC